MRTYLRKWGHSLAVRIPVRLAAEAGLGTDSPVELSMLDGKLIIVPAAAPAPTLEDLLARVTKDNLHSETETGAAVGQEAW